MGCNRMGKKNLPNVNPSKPFFYVVNTNLWSKTAGSPKRIAAVVETLAGLPTRIEHYRSATPERIDLLKPAGILLSGQRSPWTEYPKNLLKGITDVIRTSDIPILGICGGHQLIALAHGAESDRIQRLKPGKGYEGCLREYGFKEVSVIRTDPILGRIEDVLTLFESHYDEVKVLPEGYEQLAITSLSPIQAFRHSSRLVWGVQFHPEKFDHDHRDGEMLLRRFIQLCLERYQEILSTNQEQT